MLKIHDKLKCIITEHVLINCILFEKFKKKKQSENYIVYIIYYNLWNKKFLTSFEKFFNTLKIFVSSNINRKNK